MGDKAQNKWPNTGIIGNKLWYFWCFSRSALSHRVIQRGCSHGCVLWGRAAAAHGAGQLGGSGTAPCQSQPRCEACVVCTVPIPPNPEFGGTLMGESWLSVNREAGFAGFLPREDTVFLLFNGLVISATREEINNVLRTYRLFLKTL